MKKILSFTLACAVGLSAMTAFAQNLSTEASHLIEKGYIQGTELGYELDREATNAEALTLLYRAAGKEAVITPDSNHWADGIIKDASENGVIAGEEETNIIFGTLDTTGDMALLVEDEYLLHTDNTVVVIGDEITNYADAKDRLNGVEANVVISTPVTASLPAQTTAHYILVTTETVRPIYMEVSEVTEEDGALLVHSVDGNCVAALEKMADLNPLFTRNIIKACDLKKGDKIVVWSEMMTMSIPALLNSNKVTVLHQSEAFVPDSTITANDLAFIGARLFGSKVDAALPVLDEAELITRDILAKFCFALLK